MKIQISEKKRQPFQWKQVFDHFFPELSSMEQLEEQFIRGSIRISDDYCGTYKSIF